MKKNIYFDPPKKTSLEEYITIKYGKIRDVHILQLAVTHESLLKLDPKLNRDLYMPLKNFHAPLKLKRVDKYISKQKRLKYTHEVILPSDSDFNNMDSSKVPPSNFILKGMVGNRKMYIRLNFIDNLVLSYYSSSWSNLNTSQKITIIGIIAAPIIGVFAIISN